jgi:hypothetical protein
MTRKILLISKDEEFIRFVEISTLTLTKLNYQVDIIRNINDYIDLAIIDFDLSDAGDYVSQIRSNKSIKNKKIIGVYSSSEKINKTEIFKIGCDSLMSKKDFEKAGNNILMF